MITDADIKKMKEVFATKEDLKSFDKRFDAIDRRFVGIDKRFVGIDKRFDQMDKKIDNLSKNVQKGNAELVELITNGFDAYEKRITRIEAKVFNAN